MSLDDLIKSKMSSERGREQGWGRGRGWTRGRGGATRGRGTGMARQGLGTQPSSYKIAKSFNRAKQLIYNHDLFAESMKAAGIIGVETGTKLYISNLDYGVSNEDIKELFSEIGALKRSAVHYDRNGRPTGSAEVVFTRRSDAMASLKRYNNVLLDGKAMKIEVIGTNLGLPVTPRVNVGGANGRGRSVVLTPQFGRGGTRSLNRMSGWSYERGFQQGRGRGRGQVRGRGGRGRGRKQPVGKSADQLDKELEAYHTEAMNIS